jgi:hypothetical protein
MGLRAGLGVYGKLYQEFALQWKYVIECVAAQGGGRTSDKDRIACGTG